MATENHANGAAQPSAVVADTEITIAETHGNGSNVSAAAPGGNRDGPAVTSTRRSQDESTGSTRQCQPPSPVPWSGQQEVLTLLDAILSEEELGRDRGDRGDRGGGGGGAARDDWEYEDNFLDDCCDGLSRCFCCGPDVICGERVVSLNRAFGLPLAAFAFITIFLPVSIHRYGFVSNVHEHKLSSRPFQAMKYIDFNFLPNLPFTTKKGAYQPRRYASGANTSFIARQWFARDKQPAPSTSPSVMARFFGLKVPAHRGWDSATRARFDAGTPKQGAAELAGPSMLRALLQTRRFFEPRSTTSPPPASADTRHTEGLEADEHDLRRGGGRGDAKRGGAAQGGGGGQPVPPLSRSQLWCVYRPPDVREREQYLLEDVPVSLCTAVVYCCLDVWKHGVRLYQDTTAAPGADFFSARPHGVEYQEGDGGPNGIYHFYRLRTALRGTPKLRLYAMLGGRKQTTWNFVRKMASSSSSSDEDHSSRSGAAGRSGTGYASPDNVAAQVLGLLSRPVNYTVLDKLVDLSARWLKRMKLDGFVFNYRTDPHQRRADTVYLLHFREFHQRLAERGFEVSLVLPDAVASARRSANDVLGTERRRPGAPSVARLVATGYTPLVLPTHDLVPQDRLLHGLEHRGYHDDAAADLPLVDGLPPPSEEEVDGLNGTSAATCPAPYASDDPALLTQEAMLRGRYGKLSTAMKLSTLVTVSFKADHYKLLNARLYKELTPAYKVGEATYRDLCRLVNGTTTSSSNDEREWSAGEYDERRPDSTTHNGARSYYGARSACLVVQSGHDWYSGFGPESARALLLDGAGGDYLGVVAFDMEADDFTGSCGGVRHPLTRQLRRMLWLNEQRRPADIVVPAADAA